MLTGIGWRRPSRRRRKKSNAVIARRFQRYTVEIWRDVTGESVSGRAFLNDITLMGMGSFSTSPIPVGEVVSLVIHAPRTIYLKAEVKYCYLHTLNTRVISPESFHYRVQLVFHFETWEEQTAFIRYCGELQAG